ncbi:hypothetical protein GMPD_15740 [Geomonas paludis]|uniref:Lipoprotein n=1 Tax=Geomonas paludis TaxID=2740185 RepID=A0A6V8MU04_9BACT|nr:hypothetical protein GMPD_15740 [Geomonas paludis]
MKKLTTVTFLILMAAPSFADEYVRGYARSNGTYVNGYTRSERDSSYNNNYSTSPNVNPYTGERGTRSPTYNDRTPTYNTNTYGNSGTYGSGSYGTRSGSGSSRSYGGYGY